MRESDLYIPARDWLVKHGYTIRVEVFDADIIATKDDPACHGGTRIVAVELKPCLTEGLIAQLRSRATWADEVWGVIASDPKVTTGLRYEGFGLLRVVDGKVRMLRKAQPQPMWRHKLRVYRLKKLAGLPVAEPHHLAGLPSCPQLKAQRMGTPTRP